MSLANVAAGAVANKLLSTMTTATTVPTVTDPYAGAARELAAAQTSQTTAYNRGVAEGRIAAVVLVTAMAGLWLTRSR